MTKVDSTKNRQLKYKEIDNRMQIIANLIIDKLLEDKRKRVLYFGSKFSNLNYGTQYED